MANGTAKVGGEYGVNNEWYEGGQFLPSERDFVKGSVKRADANKRKRHAKGKQCVSPYTWALPPEYGYMAIWSTLNAGYFHVIETTDHTRPTLGEFRANAEYFGESHVAKMHELRDAYNSGFNWHNRETGEIK